MSDDDPRAGLTIEQLHGQLRAAVEAIETGEQWRSWLDFAGRLHRYSFDNLMLIKTQRPDATAIASYTTWKAASRQVQRGERSIKVLAPIIRRVRVTDNAGRPVLDSAGQEQTRQSVVGFRPMSVLDVSQTIGPPVPQPVHPTVLAGVATTGLWDAVAAEVAERGYRLLRAGRDRLGSANGATVPNRREVWVRDDLNGAQAVKTLAHELAHVMLHATDGGDAESCRGVMEVEAESVAYLVLAAHGMASDAYSFPYVANWAYPIAAVEHVALAEVVTRTGRRVVETARMIIDTVQRSVPTSASNMSALVVRTKASAERTTELREESVAHAILPAERAMLLGIVSDSYVFFRSRLPDSWVPKYLTERGLRHSIASHGIGHAPKGWTALTDHLRSLGYTDDHIQAAGMATRARSGHLIDRFRDRMTFPIRDGSGELVGFTARACPNADPDNPKYLNSPATSIFTKGKVLFGLPGHQDALRPEEILVICEGPLDAIAVDFAAQQTESTLVGLATCGTAFTDAHAHLVTEMPHAALCLAFDGDDAGRAAAERAWVILNGVGARSVTIAELPPGTDPAALGAADPTALAQRLLGARGAAYVLVDRKIAKVRLEDNPPRHSAMFRDVVDWARRLPVEQRVDLAVYAARRLAIDPADAAAEITHRHRAAFSDAAPDVILECCAVLANALADSAEGPQSLGALSDPARPAIHNALTR